jgi:endo-1,3(4)-beta-glucanase
MTRRATILTVVGAGVAVSLVIFLLHSLTRPKNSTVHSSHLVDQATLAKLPHKSASSADTSHLSEGLLPPTNMWLSGMVLQKTPETVFPMPLSFLAKDTGFEIGLPTITSTATEISGPHTPGISVGLGATGFKVTRYDKLSATLTYAAGSNTLGALTLTEGSPFVYYKAASPQTVHVNDINPADILEHTEHYLRYNRAGHTYAIFAPKSRISITATGLIVQAGKGSQVTLYALPSTKDVLRPYADNAIQSVAVSHYTSGGRAHTTFRVKTDGGKPTALAAMPYQTFSGKNLAGYQSIWGVMPTSSGTTFTTSVAAVKPAGSLDLSRLSTVEKQELITSLAADVSATTIDAEDSYYAGKQLARAANLLAIAQQLEQKQLADQLQAKLLGAFAARLGSSHFYYDTKLHGVAATTSSFGSEDFNDHHFHYGYWLYAASILAQHDQSFTAKYEKQLNVLAADIASYQLSEQFPLYRTFDPYVGHSWAAGLAPFADGNNQESSSESVHAWNGIALWGQVTDNSDLQQTGEWMLSTEANTAQQAWRSVNTSSAPLHNYSKPIASLNFGGKRTYNTFFSDAPSAKLGIQLIPMDPSMEAYRDKNILSSVSASIQNDNFNVPLGDYILMYLALQDPTRAAELATKQSAIDDGNSKTYLLAWILSQKRAPE